MAVGKSEKVLDQVTLSALNEVKISKIANVLNYAKILAYVKSSVTGTNTVTVYLEGSPHIEVDSWRVLDSATISASGSVVLTSVAAWGAVRVRVRMSSYTNGNQVIDAWINRKRH